MGFTDVLALALLLSGDASDLRKQVRKFRAWYDGQEQLCELPAEDIRTLSEEKLNQYAEQRQPVLLLNAAEGWRAKGAWDRAGFLHKFGHFNVSAQDDKGKSQSESIDMTTLFGSAGEHVRLFLRENERFELLQAVGADARWPADADWPAPRLQRPREMRALSVSSAGASATLHRNAEAWQVQVSGRKLWWLVKPAYGDARMEGKHGFWGSDVCSYLNKRPAPASESWRCILEPGQGIFVPHNVYHGLCAIDEWTAAYGAQGCKAPLAYARFGEDARRLGEALAAGEFAVHDQDHGWTAAHFAAQDGHTEALSLLGARGASLVAETNEKRHRPLHLAAMVGHAAVIGLLAADAVAGAALEAPDVDGAAALHLAASMGHATAVDALLVAGASPNVRGKEGLSPLNEAARGGRLAVIEALVAAGGSVNALTPTAEPPAYTAAYAGHADAVATLSRLNADIRAATGAGRQPIHTAAREGHETVLRLLHELGASVEAPDGQGGRPLHVAALRGHERVVELLLGLGASVSATVSTGQQPLHLAAHGGHAAVARRLLASGAAVDAEQSNGARAIHLAALAGHEAVIRALLEQGVDTQAIVQGATALEMAGKAGHAGVQSLLRSERRAEL